MRVLISAVMAGLLLASPALAQSGTANNKPADSGQKAAPPSQSQTQQPSTQPAAKPEPPKDQTMGNFDVTGSSANDAMGSAPP